MALTAALTALGLVVSGCTSDDGDETPEQAASGEERTVRLLLRDGSLRVLGSDCAGSGAYLYVHRSSTFTVQDGDGQELATGELPGGEAVKALDEEFGNARRIPTFCEFAVPVTVPEADSYQLVLEKGSPIDLTPQDHETEGKLLVGLLP